MCNVKMLAGLVLLACAAAAVAADKQVLAQNDAVVAKKAAVRPVKPVVSKPKDEGDSRVNDYALERSSCCGPN